MTEKSEDSESGLPGLKSSIQPIQVQLIGAIPVPRIVIISLSMWFLVSLPAMVILGLYTHLAFSNASDARGRAKAMVQEVRDDLRALESELKGVVADHSVQIEAKTEKIVKEVKDELKMMSIDVENNKLYRISQQEGSKNGPDNQEEN